MSENSAYMSENSRQNKQSASPGPAENGGGELKHDNWVGTTYGNSWMHRWLIRFLRVIDVRLLYGFAYLFVVPPTMLVNSSARRVTYSFYRRHMAMGALKSAWMTLRNHWAFAEVVIDKFAMYAGKKFRITLDGYELWEQLEKGQSGFVQLSSHIGNYEIAGYSLKCRRKRFNALVFGGEKESVMANRSKLFDSNNIRMIPLKPDMSHLFIIDAALANGEILSMPADRIFGSQKSFLLPFLGQEANFPQGPFIMAAVRNVPLIFVAVMKRGARHYHITIRKIELSAGGNTRQRAGNLASEYVRLLESTVRKNPEQWYNYFDFWKKE